MPILFAFDAKLAVAGGIVYVVDGPEFERAAATDQGGDVSFGTSFSDSGFQGDHESFGGADGSSSDAGGGDGGDGGGGGD